jgi:DNA-binding NarL/FixJ family response regulator
VIGVFVIDDHPVVRGGILAMLEGQADISVAGSAGSAEELLAAVDAAKPDIILLDLALPGMSGIEVISRLARRHPNSRVVVFSARDDDVAILDAMRAGARGYVVKGAPGDEILRAIREVHAGNTHLHGPAASAIARELRSPRPADALTPREREVLRLVGEGLQNKQIAKSLGIAERTAKYHIRQIMTKLGADNRAQAVALASRRRLL